MEKQYKPSEASIADLWAVMQWAENARIKLAGIRDTTPNGSAQAKEIHDIILSLISLHGDANSEIEYRVKSELDRIGQSDYQL